MFWDLLKLQPISAYPTSSEHYRACSTL